LPQYDAFLSFNAADESVAVPIVARSEQAGYRIFQHQIAETIPLQDYRVLLLKNLTSSFNLDDLKMLCFELGIDIENLSGDTLNAKSLGLIEFMRRQGRLNDLADACTVQRGHLLWFDEQDNFASDEQRKQTLKESKTLWVMVGKAGLGRIQRVLILAAQQQYKHVVALLLPDAARDEQQNSLAELGVLEPPVIWGEVDSDATIKHLATLFQDTQSDEVWREGVCPYRGLGDFKQSDARFFYGREVLVERILTKISASLTSPSATRFLAIVGASGSGKSSLAQAGVLAQLQKQGTSTPAHAPLESTAETAAPVSENHNEWQIVICRPGYDPLESLTQAIGTSGDGAAFRKLIDDMGASEEALHREILFALQDTPQRRMVILVDQFEEIFASDTDKGEARRAAFVRNLLYAARAPHGKTLVVITLRDDFIGKCSKYPDLRIAVSDHQEIVGPMNEAELRAAIENPAWQCNLQLDTGLTDALICEVLDQPGSLPFLGFALLELWSQRDKQNRLLTYASYQKMGGVAGALQRRADDIFDKLGADQELCKRIFLRLTQPSNDEGQPDTKRRSTLSELIAHENERDAVKRVINALIEARLITVTSPLMTRSPVNPAVSAGLSPSRPRSFVASFIGRKQQSDSTSDRTNEQIVEVTHETLIVAWPRLQSWVIGARNALRLRLRLRMAALEWERNPQKTDYLLRGRPLQDVARIDREITLDALESRFLRACIRHRNRGWVLKAGAGGLIVVILTVFVARRLSAWQPVTGFERDILLSLDAVHPSGGKPSLIILAGTANAGVVRNIDDDATKWRTYSDRLPRSSASGGIAGKGVVGIDRLAVDRATSQTIYAGIQRQGIYTSTNYGVTWHPTSLLSDTILLDMSANGPLVIAVSSRHNVFISTDSLASFTFLTATQLPASPSAVGIDPSGERVYIGTDNGLYSRETTNASIASSSASPGVAWKREVATPPINVMSEDAKRSGFYLATYDPLTSDSALYHWQPAAELSMTVTLPGKVMNISPNPVATSRFEVFVLVTRFSVLSYPLVTEVWGIERSGAMTSLGRQIGYTRTLLAVQRPSPTTTVPATWLLLGHCEGPTELLCSANLMEYQGKLD
jgi:Effector-associated domain 7